MTKSKDGEHEDRVARIERMREELEELGGEVIRSDDDDLPTEVEEKFLEHVLAWERASHVTYFDALEQAGKTFPPPEELDDAELTEQLWQLIHALALLRVYLHCTDHLNDRQLYEQLWHDCLREETVLFPENPDYGCHLDLIGSGSEEDTMLYLQYYADDEWRQQWIEEFPDSQIPERVEPPFDRDRHLPQRETLPHEPGMDEQ